jgi:hypothetical protein
MILEKGDPLNRANVDANLCIMVLMLQSSNRDNQDSLRLFRDRGDVHGFARAMKRASLPKAQRHFRKAVHLTVRTPFAWLPIL